MKMTFTAVGDMLVQRRIHPESAGFAQIQEHLAKSDVRYVNLETTLHRGEHYANQFSGGSYLRADPETLEDVKALRAMDLYGAIIGKAYYTGAIDLKEALEVAK